MHTSGRMNRKPFVFFWTDTEEDGCFSNWYKSKFVIDDFEYFCVEQYMMAQKAKLFHDSKRYTAILHSDHAWECKKLGKDVTPFVPKEWDKVRYEIVKAGNRAKYEQNPALKARLLNTGNAVLAEASPNDTDWGIGLDAASAERTDPSGWPGQNLLGRILMELREEFAKTGTDAPETEIRLIQGDIAKTAGVDAIVNAANTSLLGGGGVDGAIHLAAGPQLLQECRTLHGCKTGQAKITGAYNLPCKYVIHTVGPIWNREDHREEELLESCYWNSLLLAVDNGIRRIAFPSISTGAYGYPVGHAAETAIQTVCRFIKAHPGELDLVEWVLYDDRTYEAYNRVMSRLKG